MPATDFGWSVSQSPPIFQVYGTKRKCSPSDQEIASCPKRVCQAPSFTDVNGRAAMETQPVLPDILSQQQSQITCSVMAAPHIQQGQHQVSFQMPSHQACLSSNPPAPCFPLQPPTQQEALIQENNNNIVDPAQYNQNDMIMDLHDETYSTVQLPGDSEYESACGTMDAEGAPDSNQYKLSFCDEFCVGGDTSPNSGKVRCFCKPSWEGLTHARPYVSDYY